MGRGWRVGRIAGIELRVDPSLFLLSAIIAFNTWDFLSSRFPELGSGGAIALAVATAVLFELSILVHELAHAVTARIRGIRVFGITLYMLGGLTYTDSDRTPGDEFVTTVVGPLSSAALGGLFLLADLTGRGVLARPVIFLLGYLAVVNLVMAAFNLLPGFPMDGGRLLLAGLWKLLNDRTRATVIAARIGQGVAILIAGMGIVWLASGNGDVWGLWPILIGWVLFQSAAGTLAQASQRKRLDATAARELMGPPPPTVPPDLPVMAAMSQYLAGHDGEAFPVMEDGHVAGFISLRLARSAQPDRTVREVMAAPTAVIEAEPGEPLSTLTDRMGDRGTQAVMVVEEGRLVGVIEPEDLKRFVGRRPG